MSITIFSRPIRSGKTGELQSWVKNQKDADGILMPDIEGRKKIMFIRTGQIIESEWDPRRSNESDILRVGRFCFLESSFEKANNYLSGCARQLPQFLIIDEIGKLELEKKGFYPAAEKIIRIYSELPGRKLVLVIREELLETAVSFFNIRQYELVSDTAGI